MKAPLPNNEAERLDALARYAIIESAPEQLYEDVTALASSICGTPMSLVTFVEADRQWFKSRLGTELTETPREQAFCAHAILQPQSLLVVEDATRDPRFADNELVLGDPHIRFYAGSPLVTPTGEALGTLCVMDYAPRTLEPQQAEALAALSRQVMVLLDQRRINRELANMNAALEAEIAERIHVQAQHEATIAKLEQASSHIKTLEGLIPICASCKHIRTGENDWAPLEVYLAQHANAVFSHGLCNDCLAELYPELYGPDGIRKRKPGMGENSCEHNATHIITPTA